MHQTTEIDTQLVARLRLAVGRLARRLRQQAEANITPSGLSALMIIEQGPLTLGELAARERVQPPSMTRIIARLEESGLVTRSHDPRDGRVYLVALTAEGHRTIDRMRTRKNAYLAKKLRSASREEIAALEQAVSTLERILQEGDS
jgi:DNA-binding MarR family transcriptional regulator